LKYRSNNEVLRDELGQFVGLCHACRPDKHQDSDNLCPVCPACYAELMEELD